MNILAIVLALSLLALGGCASPPGAGPGSQPAGGTDPAPPPKPSLAAEQRRLSELFRGTPVVFEMQSDGTLRVAVPLSFSFDKGRYAVKAPLAAVLDRVARIPRSESTRFFIAAPADTQVRGQLLASERASSTRDYLVARGVAVTRLAIVPSTAPDVVSIVVADLSAQ